MATITTSAAEAKDLVRRLRSDPDNVDLHQLVRGACTAEAWSHMSEAGYVEFFIEYMGCYEHGDMRSNGLPAWCLPAWGLSLALQASNTCPPSFRQHPLNLRALTHMRSAVASKLSPQIFADRAKLVVDSRVSEGSEGSPGAEECIRAACTVYFGIMHSLKVYPSELYMDELRSSQALENIFLCWYYTSSSATRITSSICLESLLEDPTGRGEALARLLRTASTPSGSGILTAEQIAVRAKDCISEPSSEEKKKPGHRLVELCLVQWLLDDASKVAPILGRAMVEKAKIHVDTFALIGKLLNEKDDGGVNWEIVDMAGAVILNAADVAPQPGALVYEYVQQHDVLGLLSRILLEGDGDSIQVWTNLLELFVHYTTCQVNACKHRTSEAYVNAVRSALAPSSKNAGLWATTLERLIKNLKSPYAVPNDNEKQRCELWVSLGRGVGLAAPEVVKRIAPPSALIPPKVEGTKTRGKAGAKEEPGEPRKPESVIGCWNVQCPKGKHGADNEQEAEGMKRCSGCSIARYCGNECQLNLRINAQFRDWKAHKAECKAFKWVQQREQVREDARKQLSENLQEA